MSHRPIGTVSPDGTLALVESAPVNYVRPSADLLFRSLASSCGERAIAVVLSGSGRDGAAGLADVKKRGGKVIAQNEETSEFFGMPGAAAATGYADLILPVQHIPGALISLISPGSRKISFLDVTRYVALQQELAEANRRVQAANRKLKASNEELQSTNLEMQSLTEEARRHTQQMDQLHHFLSSILSSMRNAVVVVDRDLRITTWNQAARDLWGLSAEEVQGEHLIGLDIGLDLSPLRRPIMECLDGRDVDPELEVDATSRRGTPVHLRITFSPLKTGPDEISGVVLTMDMVRPRQ